MHLRPAKLGEIELIQSIGVDADQRYVHTSHPELCDGTSIPAEVAAKAVADGRLWVAQYMEEPVGWLYLTRLENELCIGHICVAIAYGRRGIGTALLHQAKAHASLYNERSIILATQLDIPWNAPWYIQHGFSPLNKSEWTAAMRVQAEKQQSAGLNWNKRVFMRLTF